MNLIDILKAKGVSDELITAIQEDMKANSIYTASEENLDIRYGKLKTQNEANVKELETTKATLEEVRNATKDHAELQQKLADHDKVVAQLQQELADAKWQAEAKVGLLAAGASDVDYLMFKLEESMKAEGKEKKLDDNGKIPGWADLLSGLQTKVPTHFNKPDGDGGYQVLNPNKLKNGDNGDATVTKERFMGMSYEERMNLKQTNEKRYNELAK